MSLHAVKECFKKSAEKKEDDAKRQSHISIEMTGTKTSLEDQVNNCKGKDDDTEMRLLNIDEELQLRLQSDHATSGHATCSPLHGAAEEGASSLEILNIPNSDGLTPLMAAVSEANLESVKRLIKAGAHINARNERGETSLHLLVFAIHNNSQELTNISNALLEHEKIDLEPQDHSKLTPLALAAKEILQSDETPQNRGLITYCKALVAAGASLSEDIKKDLQQKNVLTAVEMSDKRSPPPRPDTSKFLDMILHDKEDAILTFLENMSGEDAREGVNLRLGRDSILFRVINQMKEPLVKQFLKAGADTWALEISGELPIHQAIAKGHFKILDLIITTMKEQTWSPLDLRNCSYNLLRRYFESTTNENNGNPDVSPSTCLERLLKNDILLDVKQLLVEGNYRTRPLHLAASFKDQEALDKLLCHAAFLGARREEKGKDKGNVLPALLPSTLEHVMDGCIHGYKEIDKKNTEAVVKEDYTLLLDYSFLIPPTEENEMINEMKTLMEISQSKRHRPAIKHPLVQTLLYAKWGTAYRLYGINLFIYFMYVVLLIYFVCSIKELRVLETKANNFNTTTEGNNSTLDEDIDNKQITVDVLKIVLIILTVYLIFKEMFQIYVFKFTYFKRIENWLELTLIIVIFIICFADFDIGVIRHLAAWTMIVAWYELVLLSGRIPFMSMYIMMLRNVTWNFFKFISLFVPIFLAFTFSFYIILQPLVDDDSEFSGIWTTLAKAIVMATGEFDYSDLYKDIPFQIGPLFSAIMMFLLFLFFVFLVLMNVLNGLALLDTQEVHENAEIIYLISLLECIYLLEEASLICPWRQSQLSRLQVLSGSQNSNILHAMINKENKKDRLAYGVRHERLLPLDDKICSILRDHRLRHINDVDQQQREICLEKAVQIIIKNEENRK